MKSKRWVHGWIGVLAISLAVNGLLLALIGSSRPGEPAAGPRLMTTVSDPIAVVPAMPDESAAQVFKWTELMAEDLSEYAEKLRELGCPEHVTAHFGINESVANEVYAAQQVAETAAIAIRGLELLEPEQHFEALAEVRSAAERRVREQMDEPVFGVYLRHADWLKALTDGAAKP